MSRAPFIGLSGIKDGKAAAEILKQLGPTPRRIVVMFADTHSVFPAHERLLPAVRFRTERRHGLAGMYQQALGWRNGSPAGTGVGPTALEVDIPWPNPDDLRSIRQMGGQSVILRIGRQAFNEAWGSVDELAGRLTRYKDAVTDVTFDVAEMRESWYGDTRLAYLLLGAAKQSLPGVQLGVREHLSRDALIGRALPLLRAHPKLSIETDVSLLPAEERWPGGIARLVADIAALAA